MIPRTRRCFCGAVELEMAGEPAVQAYCHCVDCREWLGAPVHAASLWPTDHVRVTKGKELLGETRRTENSHRQFCTRCGAPVRVVHPQLGLTDVPAGGIEGLDYAPTVHVYYGTKVLAVRDGLPKYRDFPKDFGGSGETLEE